MAEGSLVASMSVAADSSFDEANFSITESMVSFLRTEANHADERAKRLRKQAAEIAQQFGITEESQQSYGACQCHLQSGVPSRLQNREMTKHKTHNEGNKTCRI